MLLRDSLSLTILMLDTKIYIFTVNMFWFSGLFDY